MAFFLLGRVGDTLNMLCPGTFASRQDALAALSRVTAEPDFDQWDAEVLLLDTDQGTPVLLVRPHSDVVAAASVAEPVEELEVIVIDELDEPIVVDAEQTAVDHEPFAVGDQAIADAIVEEFTEESEPDAAAALKDALTRTAVQMESEGIFAPESIGSPASPEPAFEAVFETEYVIAPETTEVPESAEEPEAVAAPETAEEPEAVAAFEPEAVASLEPESDFALTPEGAEHEGPAEVVPGELSEVPESGWPWDVASETTMPEPSVPSAIEYVLSELEEPSLDDGSILRGSIDDESFAAARPVIMGSYGEAAESASDTQPDVVVDSMGIIEADQAVSVPRGFDVPVVGDAGEIFPMEPATLEPSDEVVEALPPVDLLSEDVLATGLDSNISDFILDLGTVPAEESATPSADAAGLDAYTCADCIYEETCPNKDQRLPKDCGSFQWR